MVPAAKVDCIDIHTTIISPIVSQSQNEFHVGSLSSFNHNIKLAQINLDASVLLKELHDSVLSTSTVLRQTTRDISPVVVVEGPGAHDFETSVFCKLKA